MDRIKTKVLPSLSYKLNTRIRNRIKKELHSKLIEIFNVLSISFTQSLDYSRKMDGKLTHLIKKQTLSQIFNNVIIQLPNENPIENGIEHLYLDRTSEDYQTPSYRYHFDAEFIFTYEDNHRTQNIAAQFEIYLPYSFTMEVFFYFLKKNKIDFDEESTALIINYFGQIINWDSSYTIYISLFEVIRILISNIDIDYKEKWIQLVLKCKDNLDNINDSEQIERINAIGLKCEELFNELVPINFEAYIQFRNIVKKITAEFNFTDDDIQKVKNIFFTTIFNCTEIIDIEFSYSEESYLYSLKNIEIFMQGSTRDHDQQEPKTENEVIILGYSLYYIFVYLRENADDLSEELLKDEAFNSFCAMLEKVSDEDINLNTVQEKDLKEALDFTANIFLGKF